MFTDPETHIDFGFGILASNFQRTADFLWENNPNKSTIGLLPNLYMYRHAIELYLKSLIVIIHRKLKLDYKGEDVPYDSKKPYIMYKDDKGVTRQKEITRCHSISTLYSYFEILINEHEERLQTEASQKLSRIINPENQRIIDHIKNYDNNSTYFRYSDLSSSNQNIKESEKHYNRKIKVEDLEANIEIDKPSTFFVIINPESGELVEAHIGLKEMPLKDLASDLRDFVEYLSGIHAMFRITLCDGY